MNVSPRPHLFHCTESRHRSEISSCVAGTQFCIPVSCFQIGAFVPLRKLKKNPRPGPQANAGASQVQTELDRPTADEIYEQVSRNARHELDRSALGLCHLRAGRRNHHGPDHLEHIDRARSIGAKLQLQDSSLTFFIPSDLSPLYSAGLSYSRRIRFIQWRSCLPSGVMA